MIVGDRFRLLATKDSSKQMNYIIVAKGIKDQTSEKKGYLCEDEEGQPRFFPYSQFHVLKSQRVIQPITEGGVENETI